MLRGDCRVYAVSGDSCSGFRVQGSGFRVQGSGQDAPESNLGEVSLLSAASGSRSWGLSSMLPVSLADATPAVNLRAYLGDAAMSITSEKGCAPNPKNPQHARFRV